VDHPNYNPRIVEYMTDPMWVDSSESSKYPALFLGNLQEPFLVWEQAFNNHLTNTARDTLFVLGSLPREVFVEDLESAVKHFLSREGPGISRREFCRALSELQDNFIVLRRDRGNDIVAFHNPSVQDFVESYLDKNPDLYAVLLQAACFFEQAHWTCERVAKKGRVEQLRELLETALQETLSAPPCTIINYSSDRGRSTYKGRERLKYGTRLAFIATLLEKREFSFLCDFFREALDELTKQTQALELANDDLLVLAKRALALDCITDLEDDFFSAAKESLFQNAYWVSDVSCITDLFELRPQRFTLEDRERIKEALSDIVSNNLDDDDPQLLDGELSDLEEIDNKYSLGLEEQVNRVRDLLSSAEENCPPEDDYDDDRYRGARGGEWIGNNALADMFSTLLR
jgi:hypothetical protein